MSLVSVVMPAYNVEQYLAASIESILAQTFTDFEFIIVDDGSTDGTVAIVEGIVKKDSRVRLISRPNTGIVGALNDGLDAASGELIARMDGDDLSMPERFERQVQYLKQHLECIALGTAVRMVDQRGTPILDSNTRTSHEEIDQLLMAGEGNTLVHPTVMMRAAAVEAVGRYDEETCWVEDLDLFLRLAEHGRVANLPEILLDYRQHATSVNATRRETQIARAEQVLRSTHERRGVPWPDNYEFPGGPARTASDTYSYWTWLAIEQGRLSAARTWAMDAVRSAPLRLSSWKALISAWRRKATGMLSRRRVEEARGSS